MMTEREIVVRIAATLTTLLDVNGSPESTIYLAYGMNWGTWNLLRGIMERAGWIVVRNFYVTLTPSGKVKAAECQAIIDEAGRS